MTTEQSQQQAVRSVNPTTDTSNKDVFQSTWGDLVDSEGGMVWETLTDEQQDKVNYPELDKAQVYWVPKGKSYHAVEWCYTLSRSKDIRSGSLSEAMGIGLKPCSKCVGD